MAGGWIIICLPVYERARRLGALTASSSLEYCFSLMEFCQRIIQCVAFALLSVPLCTCRCGDSVVFLLLQLYMDAEWGCGLRLLCYVLYPLERLPWYGPSCIKWKLCMFIRRPFPDDTLSPGPSPTPPRWEMWRMIPCVASTLSEFHRPFWGQTSMKIVWNRCVTAVKRLG